MTKQFTLVIEKDEDGWLISDVVELPGCHTQAKTMDQLLERTKEAIRAYLGSTKNVEISEKFVGVQQIEV
ncbi:TPA: type II toxin-antitoxin system HicB family antitoxin [Candidatus Woesearchaeota archaeon]|nr:type II toxin-antitoxin system HicB family antitoxin [Candidatus Woesearchaeota archaeon]